MMATNGNGAYGNFAIGNVYWTAQFPYSDMAALKARDGLTFS